MIGGRGSPISSSGDGTIGLPGGNGAIVTGCNGGAGGGVGVGEGPGAINNGGNGGYYNAGVWLGVGCTAHGDDYGLTPGAVGKNSLVKIVW